MRSIIRAMSCLVLLLASLIIALATPETTGIRCYPQAGRGSLQLAIPTAWTEEIQQPSSHVPSTLVFKPVSGNKFEFLVTPVWPDRGNLQLLSAEAIRRQLQEASGNAEVEADAAAPEGQPAAEAAKPSGVKELEGTDGGGYYFTATDAAAKPGTFKYTTHGIISVGAVYVIFTYFATESGQKSLPEALAALTTATASTQTIVPVPGQAWGLAFHGPDFSGYEHQLTAGAYQSSAVAGNMRIMIEVDLPRGRGGDTAADCYRVASAEALRHPDLVKITVAETRTERYQRLRFSTVTRQEGKSSKQWHVLYCLAHQGRWVIVRLTVTDPTPRDEGYLAAIDASLACVPRPIPAVKSPAVPKGT